MFRGRLVVRRSSCKESCFKQSVRPRKTWFIVIIHVCFLFGVPSWGWCRLQLCPLVNLALDPMHPEAPPLWSQTPAQYLTRAQDQVFTHTAHRISLPANFYRKVSDFFFMVHFNWLSVHKWTNVAHPMHLICREVATLKQELKEGSWNHVLESSVALMMETLCLQLVQRKD